MKTLIAPAWMAAFGWWGLATSLAASPTPSPQAVDSYRKAADQGDAAAECDLGYCYEKGSGVEKDLDKAAALYIRAADEGNSTAQDLLRNLLHDRKKRGGEDEG